MKQERQEIPFGTITITEKTKSLIAAALESKRISSGKLVREFEEKFASLFGVREAVAVSSGTDADALALAVLYDYGAQRGDEIIVPALSFVATGNAVLHAGFIPVFADIERETLNINPNLIEQAITERTRAIMPVHLMGKPADMDGITDIAKRHNLYVIEDAAEAYGAMYKGRKIGTIGDIGAFSLYVAHIITTGEGGAVVTNDKELADLPSGGLAGVSVSRDSGIEKIDRRPVLSIGLDGEILAYDGTLDERLECDLWGESDKDRRRPFRFDIDAPISSWTAWEASNTSYVVLTSEETGQLYGLDLGFIYVP